MLKSEAGGEKVLGLNQIGVGVFFKIVDVQIFFNPGVKFFELWPGGNEVLSERIGVLRLGADAMGDYSSQISDDV
jgi:hypothetical protein